MSSLAFVQTGCLVIFALLLLGAAWHDLRTQRIANQVSLATIAVYSLWAAAGVALGRMSGTTVAISIACSMFVFAAAAAGFAAGVIGGGDVKLLSAATLFAGPAHLADLLIVTALAGGVVALAVLAGAPIGPAPPASVGTMDRLRSRVPYGPAIAAGGLWIAGSIWAS